MLYNVFVVAEESLFSSIANAQNEEAAVRNTLSFNLSTNLIILHLQFLYYFNQHADTQARRHAHRTFDTFHAIHDTSILK